MPKVRLSGNVEGPNDPNRSCRALLLYLLYSEGWDIYNSNGDQRITLSNIERKIQEADAFVFTPDASIEDLFKAVSIFVGYQTVDKNLSGKPTVVLNSDHSWDPLFDLLEDLNHLGTISQNYRDFLLEALEPESVLSLLEKGMHRGVPDAGRESLGDEPVASFENPPPSGTLGNVCVFCSATTTHEGYLADGYTLGKLLAENNLGCVSGAGRSGVMGTVVGGAVDAGGWAAGSNVPHIIKLEGLPAGLSSFWLRPDIYTRMEVMIEQSNAFIIFPGGAGTLQEMLALMIFKASNHPMMVDKPVIVFNRQESAGVRFWNKLLVLLQRIGGHSHFTVVEKLEDLVPLTMSLLPRRAS